MRPNSVPEWLDMDVGSLAADENTDDWNQSQQNKTDSRVRRMMETENKTWLYLLEARNVDVEDEVIIIRAPCSTLDMITCHLPA